MPAPTVTLAGQNGTSNATTNPLAAPSSGTYNQAAGNTILLITNSYGANSPPNSGAGGGIADVAGNSFTQIYTSDVVGANQDTTNAFYCTNCLGSAINAAVFTWAAGGSSNYKTVWYFDIGNASNLDVKAWGVSSGQPTWSTTYAAEAVVYALFQDSAGFTSVTPPAGWAQDGTLQSNYGAVGSKVFSTTQTSISPVWTWGGGGTTTMLVVGFGQTPVVAGGPNLRMLMGIGT